MSKSLRVVVTSFGTTGDIEPMLSLAAELVRHGHQVVLALPSLFKDRVTSFGFDFAPIGPYVDHELAHQVAQKVLQAGHPLGQARLYARSALAGLLAMYRDLAAVCVDADVLVGSQSQPAARMVHDATGIPYVSVQFQHFTIPSRHTFLPSWQLPRRTPFRSFTVCALWKCLEITWRLWTAGPINACRKSAALPPLPDPLLADACSPLLALCAVSPSIAQAPPDWPSQYRVTGYLFAPPSDWAPDPRLLDFVLEGPPPIVLTFGSTVLRDPAAAGQLVSEALRDVGCRAIVQRGWSNLRVEEKAGRVLLVDYAPHSWLFSHAAAVIHHGGAGTTAATFRAGVPSVVVPYMLDQSEWAATCAGRGTAGQPLPGRRLTAPRLAQRIRDVVARPEYKRAAETLAARIAGEDGPGAARQLIESIV